MQQLKELSLKSVEPHNPLRNHSTGIPAGVMALAPLSKRKVHKAVTG